MISIESCAQTTNPVAPENRDVAKLMSSRFIMRGQILRFVVNNKPYIIINTEDIKELHKICVERLSDSPFMSIDINQMIADGAEQLFAEWEAKKKK